LIKGPWISLDVARLCYRRTDRSGKASVLPVDMADQLLLQELRVAEGYLSDEIAKS
jgi:hypothetical protein